MHGNARILSEKLCSKFSSTTLGYSIARIALLDDGFLGILVLGVSPVEGQSLQQIEKKSRKKMNKNEKLIDVNHFLFDFCICPRQDVMKHNASGKEGMLSCFNCYLNRLRIIWPISSLKMSKHGFLTKSSWSQWVKK